MASKLKYYWSGGTDPTRDSIQAVSDLSNAPRGLQEIPIEQVRQLSQSSPTLRVLNLETGYALDKSLLAQPTIESSMVIGPNGQMMPATTAANYISPEQGLKAAGGGSYLTPQQSAQSFAPITSASIQAGIANLKPPPNMTPAQQAAWNNAVALIPKTDGSITSGNLQRGTNLQIAPSGGSSTSADSTVAGADATAKSIADYIKLLTPPESDKSTGVSDLIASINTELEGLKGRGTAQLAEEERQGVGQKKQLFQNAQTELNQKLAEYKSIQAKYQALNADVEGKPVTMSSIIGSQAQVNRVMLAELNTKASEISLIQAQVMGAQGNLSLAQSAADRAVSLKYQDVEDSIKIRQEQLRLLEGELSKDEKIRSQAIQMYLSEQAGLVAEQKANDKQLSSFNLDAMTRYPSAPIQVNDPYSVTQQKILNSKEYKLETQKAQQDLAGGGTVANLNKQLTDAKGSDGYTDPNLYARLRSTSTLSGSDFDNRFGYLVNPLSAARLGLTNAITSQGALSPTDYTKGLNYLLTHGATQDDQSKFQTDRSFQAWVLGKVE